ncbi:hypothetical protein ACFVVM_32530 [Nocardia sp. NPDC058176]|uniref:hypothetical protein n=1 Tax=Nocardia sp. NPDC058176 TaxID=3346368 RepID=UPI0036DD8991
MFDNDPTLDAHPRVRTLLAEFDRLMRMDNTPVEFLYPDAEDVQESDYGPAIDGVEKQLKGYLREHQAELDGTPVWQAFFGPDPEPEPLRPADHIDDGVMLPVLDERPLVNDYPF